MTQQELLIAIVGCGYMGSRHASTYSRWKQVKLLLVDQQERAAHQLEQRLSRLGTTARSVSWQAALEQILSHRLLRGGQVAIDICTPPAFHSLYIKEALQVGCPVLCEKPLSLSEEIEDEILSLADRSEGWLAVGYPYRHHPAIRWVHSILEGGELGKPHLAYFRLGVRGGRSSWKHQAAMGGGIGSEALCHLVDLAIHFFGPVREGKWLDQRVIRASRVISGSMKRVTAPDYGVLSLLHERGVRSLLTADMLSPGFCQSVEIQAECGSVWSSVRPEWPSWMLKVDPPSTQFADHAAVDLLELVLEAFSRSLASGQPDPLLRPYPGIARWLLPV